MATLTRGISFRRQGSSGMSWAENWTFTDQGMFKKKEDPAGMEHPPVFHVVDQEAEEAVAVVPQFNRSRSVGSVGSTVGTAMQIFSPLAEQVFPSNSLPEKRSPGVVQVKSQEVIRSKKKSKGAFRMFRWLRKKMIGKRS